MPAAESACKKQKCFDNYSRFKHGKKRRVGHIKRGFSPKCSARVALRWPGANRSMSGVEDPETESERSNAGSCDGKKIRAEMRHLPTTCRLAEWLIGRCKTHESPRQTNCAARAQTMQTKIKQKQWVRDANFYPSAVNTIKTQAACASALDWTPAKVILLFFGKQRGGCGGGDFFPQPVSVYIYIIFCTNRHTAVLCAFVS